MLTFDSFLTTLEHRIPITAKAWLYILTSLLIARLVSLYYHHGLHKYKGPFLASFSDLWRLCYAYRNSNREPMIHMHDLYGDVVRMGPNVLSFSQPQAIRDIYGPGKHFKKSGYYPVNSFVSKGRVVHSLFSNPDQTWHNNLRRSIGASFTVNSAAKYEPLIDSTILAFLKELDERFAGNNGGEVFDFHTWLSFFTFDVMSDLTYSARHGFVEQGKDMFGIIAYVKSYSTFGYIAGQMPTLDVFLRHNPVIMWLERREWISSITFPGAIFAMKRIREREKRYENEVGKGAADPEDLLDKFLKAKLERPQVVGEGEVLGLNLSMMIAGSETTSITLTAFFYYLLRHPRCYAKLQSEVDTQLPPKESGHRFHTASFASANALPYLHACIQEAFRIHPATSFNAERIVPPSPSGATICGNLVPSGTVVGVNAWVVQRDRGVFGADAHEYRPERWLGPSEQVKQMEKTMFQFGAGDHICLGKNISLMEIYKLIPALMQNFEMTLENPDKEWTLITGANVRMDGVDLRIRKRQGDELPE